MMRLWGHGIIGLSLLVTACGDDGGGAADAGIDAAPDEPDAEVEFAPVVCDSVDGSRLQRQRIEGAPGVAQELGIIDTEYDVECSYVEEADGTVVCYPDEFGGTLFFQDSGCTSPLVAVGVGTTPPVFHANFILAEDGCSVASEYRLVGVPSGVTGGQNIFQGDPNDCQQVVAPTRDYYLAGPVLSPDDFVTSTRESFHANGRLTLLVDRGSDGSAMCDHLSGIIDTEFDQGCSPITAEDDQTRCVPFGAFSEAVFDSNLCDNEVEVVSQDTACPSQPPQFEEQIIDGTCGPASAIRAVTDTEVTTPFELAADVCTGVELVDEKLFVVGDTVDPSAFQGLTPAVEEGEGRLRRQILTADGGFALFQNVWQDTFFDAPCVRQTAADGEPRCLPLALSRRTLFTDDACTNSISLGEIDECTATGAFFAANAPGGGRRIFATTPFTDPVFEQVDANCVALDGTFVEQANELAPTSFQSMP